MNKKTKLSIKKITISLGIIMILLLSTAISIFAYYTNKINKISIDNKKILPKEVTLHEHDSDNTSMQNKVTDKYIKNLALLGIDSGEDNIGRSDCILIATLDTEHDKIKLSSIIRDSYVTIPTRSSKDKINHAYAFGGAELTLQTLNNTFDLDIKQFVSVNLSSFPKIIDAIGGLTLDINNDELKYINEYIHSLNEANGTSSPDITESGIQSVDGTQALAYSRIRYTSGGDFERSHRQRIVIEQLLNKLKELPVIKYPDALDILLPMVDTNLTSSEILSLCFDLSSLNNYQIIEERFPKDEDAQGKSINGIYYYVFDEDATREKLHDFIYEN
ncbi:LCP family protein [uncultured Clostridium sp.]|uniref:LCP family protein n=1 Tax=uncultured Clostridium sp. TaxID=59620 RepID=UPI0025E70653|nr:LCP family protein [uncultured Clostridium sp.]